ncbi:hypothetical protein HYFRA_00001420 [Hymenoscyphus fraxineus]|uniref:Uncharacterized protein n=1 Tax=Hymenoscyphus fraxineus TaxID=746836 RepID=A0A9N9L887_9HELO|nr:hypothetical protein HYFRA_00001420 [Hymenoscyphus fraxineus]
MGSSDDSTGPASHEKEEGEATYSMLGHFFWSGNPLADGEPFGVFFVSRESSASDTNEEEMAAVATAVATAVVTAEAEAEAAQQRTNREIGHRFDRVFDSIDERLDSNDDSTDKRRDSIDERLDSLEKATRNTQEELLYLAERVRDAEDRLDAMDEPQVAADSGLSGWFKSMMWNSPTE